MKSARPVVLDACVLVPMPLADTLLRLAAGPRLFLPRWSDQIMAEVTRTLQETFGLSDRKAMYRESEIRQHFPEAWIEDYEDLTPAMTPLMYRRALIDDTWKQSCLREEHAAVWFSASTLSNIESDLNRGRPGQGRSYDSLGSNAC